MTNRQGDVPTFLDKYIQYYTLPVTLQSLDKLLRSAPNGNELIQRTTANQNLLVGKARQRYVARVVSLDKLVQRFWIQRRREGEWAERRRCVGCAIRQERVVVGAADDGDTKDDSGVCCVIA